MPLGIKKWTFHIVCTTCLETGRSQSQGKNVKLKFCVLMISTEPTNQVDDYYFYIVNV
uniref:Putative LOC101235972 [Hydra vulgaris] n=1 Tax=Lepeophtheirus salmonis TaxID=72036 RepID=A0A0K2UR47_LEPSM